jgi:hypothetical protein
MKTSDFTLTLLLDQTPKEAFDAINNVRGWWTENLTGTNKTPHHHIALRFPHEHDSTHKIEEVRPDTHVLWLVTDSHLSDLKDNTQWPGTQISVEISTHRNKTQVRFTHEGLIPTVECFGACSNAWTDYVRGSLLSLITIGKGQPDAIKEEV